MTDEFGFSEEPATREPDEFADMSDADFELLMEIAETVLERGDAPDRRAAARKADRILETYSRVWVGSSKIGIRKYGLEEFRRQIVAALIEDKQPCDHGHIAPITDCGVCLAQARINKHVQNPTECPHGFIPFDDEKCPDCTQKSRLCDHTRLDYSVPCPACESEDRDAEELKLEDHLAKRAAHEDWMKDLGIVTSYEGEGDKTRATQKAFRDAAKARAQRLVQHSSYRSPTKQQLPNNPPPMKFAIPPSIPRAIGNEAELTALVAVLLQKLGGEVELSVQDLERIQELTAEGKATYTVTPSFTGFSVIMQLVDSKPLRVTPHVPSGPTIARPTTPPTWADDDEDLPF